LWGRKNEWGMGSPAKVAILEGQQDNGSRDFHFTLRSSPMEQYVHGYSQKEADRLNDQADSLAQLIHHDSRWPAGSRILEAGCGVGAQTKTVAAQNPQSQFVSIDISPASIAEARERIAAQGLTNVDFQVANIFELPFADASFDHVLVCFVLEHLPNP